MKFRNSEIIFISLVLSELLFIPPIFTRVRSGQPLFPTATPVSESYGEVLRKSSCSAYQQPYPSPDQYWKTTLDITAPDGKTFLCLTNLPPAEARVSFSPDGQYMRLLILFTHSYRYTWFEVSTTKELCSNRTDMEGRIWTQPFACPVLKLADGRWWKGDFPHIALKTNDPNIWRLVESRAEVSPDGEWLVGYSNGRGYLAQTDGKIVTQYSMPYHYGSVAIIMPPCGYDGYSNVVWRPDSKQFAIIQPGDKNVFVWSILENGGVHLDDWIALEKCSYLLQLTPEGKIITKPMY